MEVAGVIWSFVTGVALGIVLAPLGVVWIDPGFAVHFDWDGYAALGVAILVMVAIAMTLLALARSAGVTARDALVLCVCVVTFVSAGLTAARYVIEDGGEQVVVKTLKTK